MAVRKFLIGQALDSYSALKVHLTDMTEEEVLAALQLESATTRRPSIIDRLISRAARLNELSYVAKLKEQFRGTSPVPQEHDQGRARRRQG